MGQAYSNNNSTSPTDRPMGAVATHPFVNRGNRLIPELMDLFHGSQRATAEREQFVFSPCWDSKHQRITAFDCEFAPSRGNLPTIEPSEGIGTSEARVHCKLDVMGLASAVQGVKHILARGELASVIVSVHVGTLVLPKVRDSYLAVLGQIESRVRILLVPRIVGLAAGSSLSFVGEWATAIHQLVPCCSMHLPELGCELPSDVPLKVWGIGFSADPPSSQTGGLRELSSRAGELKRICAAQKAVSYVDNVETSDALRVLMAREVRSISGPAIGAAQELPGLTGTVPLGDLLRRPSGHRESRGKIVRARFH